MKRYWMAFAAVMVAPDASHATVTLAPSTRRHHVRLRYRDAGGGGRPNEWSRGSARRVLQPEHSRRSPRGVTLLSSL
jgi:hypothetical protein